MSRYWFRKRRGIFTKDLGYGWIPISWEGNLAVLILILLIIVDFLNFKLWKATLWQAIGFIITLGILIGIFALVARKRTKK